MFPWSTGWGFYLIEFDRIPVPLRLPILHREVLHRLSIQQRVEAFRSLVVLLQVHLSSARSKSLKTATLTNIPEFCSPLRYHDCSTEVKDHREEYDETKPEKQTIGSSDANIISPVVELHTKVNDGDANVDKGWHNGEDEILQQVVDGGGAPVHHPQHLPRLARHVPLEAQLVDVMEQTHLDL